MARKTGGRHRAAPSRRRPRITGTTGTAAVALAGVALIGFGPGLTPGAAPVTLASSALTADPTLAAAVHYLRGTNIGDEPTDDQYRTFITTVLHGTTTSGDTPYKQVEYPASIWPASKGFFGDKTWNASVAEGVQSLTAANPKPGDIVFGFSQGAVVASKYMADNMNADNPKTGLTYVLVENPTRPNGGVMARFPGLHIPIMDLTFSNAMPDDPNSTVIDIARQYDGWADFPTYPLNVLATANAIAGIVVVHGKTQTKLTAKNLTDAKGDGTNTMYYQKYGNSEYYLVRTETLPLLMPIKAVSPDLAAALDPPLRAIIETGYDRDDYSKSTPAKLFPSVSSLQESLKRVAEDEPSDNSSAGKTSAELTRSAAKTLAATLKKTSPDQDDETTAAQRRLRLQAPKLPGFSTIGNTQGCNVSTPDEADNGSRFTRAAKLDRPKIRFGRQPQSAANNETSSTPTGNNDTQ